MKSLRQIIYDAVVSGGKWESIHALAEVIAIEVEREFYLQPIVFRIQPIHIPSRTPKGKRGKK